MSRADVETFRGYFGDDWILMVQMYSQDSPAILDNTDLGDKLQQMFGDPPWDPWQFEEAYEELNNAD